MQHSKVQILDIYVNSVGRMQSSFLKQVVHIESFNISINYSQIQVNRVPIENGIILPVQRRVTYWKIVGKDKRAPCTPSHSHLFSGYLSLFPRV
jgi:hypothetical protein